MKKIILALIGTLFIIAGIAQKDSTLLHRGNFLNLIKTHYYGSTLFHRVIKTKLVRIKRHWYFLK